MDEHAILDKMVTENIWGVTVPSLCFIVEFPNVQKSLKSFTLNTPVPTYILSVTLLNLHEQRPKWCKRVYHMGK